jgi:uncharacterized protein with HEPN domain
MQYVLPRSWKFRLEDSVDSIELIFEYSEDVDYNSWKKDRKTIDTIIRNLEIIGEAAAHIPEDIQNNIQIFPGTR